MDPLSITALVSPTPLPPIEAQTEPPSPIPVMRTGSKRKHEHVFPSSHIQPLYNGQRPAEVPYGSRAYVDGDTIAHYPRASGRMSSVPFLQYRY
jgi:hypothetical protein